MYNVWLTALGETQREKLPDLLAAFRNMEIGKDNLEQMKPYWELKLTMLSLNAPRK